MSSAVTHQNPRGDGVKRSCRAKLPEVLMGPLPDAVSRAASKPRLIASEPLAGDATDRCCGVGVQHGG
ncbi:unnamed protein product [Boreogadus saida]